MYLFYNDVIFISFVFILFISKHLFAAKQNSLYIIIGVAVGCVLLLLGVNLVVVYYVIRYDY